MLHLATATHVLRDERDLAASGIRPGALRLSIGLDDLSDLIADLDQALADTGVPAQKALAPV